MLFSTNFGVVTEKRFNDLKVNEQRHVYRFCSVGYERYCQYTYNRHFKPIAQGFLGCIGQRSRNWNEHLNWLQPWQLATKSNLNYNSYPETILLFFFPYWKFIISWWLHRLSVSPDLRLALKLSTTIRPSSSRRILTSRQETCGS